MSSDFIEICNAREHNLKNVSVNIPRNKFTVVTGVSGSGKSSLAFDTLYAEGYRMYMESLSVSARKMLEQMGKPDVDYIKSLSPVIAIEQNPVNSSPRSTVATSTEIADYARIIWSVVGTQICPACGGLIKSRTTDECIDEILKFNGKKIYILAHKHTCKASLAKEIVKELAQNGWQRLRINGEISEIDEIKLPTKGTVEIDIVVDRLVADPEDRGRIADSTELAFKEGNSFAQILHECDDGSYKELTLSNKLCCEKCGKIYNPVSVRLFSHNHPEGACPVCEGIGSVMVFKEELVVPDSSLSIKQGAIKAIRTGPKSMIIRNRALLRQLAQQGAIDLEKPWRELSKTEKNLVLYGDGKRLFLLKPRPGNVKPVLKPFEGFLPMLKRIAAHTTSDNLRLRLMAYQVSQPCPECGGSRLSQRARSVFVENVSFDKFMAMTVNDALAFIKTLNCEKYKCVADAVKAVISRLEFLQKTALSYLTLNREFSTLSGGEEERVRLATQFGLGLVGVTFILDEPSIGLHPADNEALIKSLKDLRDLGNTLVVVEHDEYAMRNADNIIELGPLAGQQGGRLIFSGTPENCKKCPNSLTGMYLSGQKKLIKPSKDFCDFSQFITVKGACEHNLKNIEAKFPIGALSVVCGVSGSGKSTLISDILAKSVSMKLNNSKDIAGKHTKITGLENFDKCVVVDQSPIGKSPRSNPATYTKIFDHLRALFAATPAAKIRGYTPARFSFNLKGGRCEHCSGDGFVALDMQFLGEVFVKCPNCMGKRYNRETLEVKYKGLNISEVLDLTVEEALSFFSAHENISRILQTLKDVGLGYIKLGQSANTLSGGEAQRMKLSLELSKRQRGKNLYILDEPTTGLHFEDIDKLSKLLFKLRDLGNTIIIIEHQCDIIKMADYVVELGPCGGDKGGYILYQGALGGLKKLDTPTSKFLK